MATIREIAAIAGVSRSTVSLVLNHSPLVKQETRELVQRVIDQTGYVPNSNARNLSWKVTKSLGIIVLSDQQRTTSYDFGNAVGLFSLNVMRGITSRLADTDYSVIIEYFCVSESQEELPKLIRERKVDGAFIVGGFCEERLIRGLTDTAIPFVTVAVGAPEQMCDSVVSDPAQGTRDSLLALIQRGRRRLGLVNCPESFRSAHLRVEGLERVFKDTGCGFDPPAVLYCRHNNGESGYDAMKAAWEKGLRFDGLAAANPQIALGAMRFLLEQGVSIPRDVSMIAYEDNALCGYAIPPLTAVNIQKEKMGQEAADLLLSRIEAPLREVQSITVPSYMVERSSV